MMRIIQYAYWLVIRYFHYCHAPTYSRYYSSRYLIMRDKVHKIKKQYSLSCSHHHILSSVIIGQKHPEMKLNYQFIYYIQQFQRTNIFKSTAQCGWKTKKNGNCDKENMYLLYGIIIKYHNHK